MSKTHHNKPTKYGNKDLKKFGNKKFRSKVKQSLNKDKELPIKKEVTNPWDWD